MMSAHERLAAARATRFSSARQAAIALGISVAAYTQYENGLRGFSRHAERFARFFRVDLNWLMTGRGEMRGKGGPNIPVMGLVTAGGQTVSHDEHAQTPEQITFPDLSNLAALQVQGDSQYPRFQKGEWVIYDVRAVKPADVLDHFAIVDLLDGRRMLKIVREGRAAHLFTLESLNAPPEHNAEVMAAYRYVGVLAAP